MNALPTLRARMAAVSKAKAASNDMNDVLVQEVSNLDTVRCRRRRWERERELYRRDST